MRLERVKPKRVRAMSMTIQSNLKENLLAAQNEAIKEENTLAEILRDVRTIIMDVTHAMRYSVHPGADKMRKQLGFKVGDKVIMEVSSWKGVKYLADANLHVPVEEVKVNKTLLVVEELVKIIDREVKSLKRSRILIVKVHWNSKRGHEDFMKTSIHTCSLSKLSLKVLIKVGYIGLLAEFSAPLNVLRWFG
ncbi:hypothetical protein Tco_0887352 [Tanacetum coccineum]